MVNDKLFSKVNNVEYYWGGYGSFGKISGEIKNSGNVIELVADAYKIVSTVSKDENGVFVRKDVFYNTSDTSVTLNSLKSRFWLDGGEYDVYTQLNCWFNESTGVWQPLNTSVSAKGNSTRTSQGAVPFMAMWNKQNQRGAAFHIVPRSTWEMESKCITPFGNNITNVVFEYGVSDYNLSIELKPGESLELPELICYEFKNKTDMDAYKLHRYINKKYPKNNMPVLYNSWLNKFDFINYEVIQNQIKPAAELGVEYFVIDAGWFGKGGAWSDAVGDWYENTSGALKGRMIDIANEVRANGMKFGLWLEPERADAKSDAVKNHKEYYFESDGLYLFDFSNPDAVNYMLEIVFKLIDHYGIEFIKFDFNCDSYFDLNSNGFINYHKGHAHFIKAIRDKYPNIYLTSCASGGARMNLSAAGYFDSIWPSDNQSIYDVLRIYKDTIYRLPPQYIEKWACLESLENFRIQYGENKLTEKIVSCNGGTWKDIEGVNLSYLKGNFKGGPIGFSCDLTSLSDKLKSELKEYIAEFKKNRSFYISADCRLLCDTHFVTVYQYSNLDLSRIEVCVFAKKMCQNNLSVYPVVDENKTYIVNGETVLGHKIVQEGIDVPINDSNEAYFISICEK